MVSFWVRIWHRFLSLQIRLMSTERRTRKQRQKPSECTFCIARRERKASFCRRFTFNTCHPSAKTWRRRNAGGTETRNRLTGSSTINSTRRQRRGKTSRARSKKPRPRPSVALRRPAIDTDASPGCQVSSYPPK